MVRLAVGQIPQPADVAGAVAGACALVEWAATEGAALLVLPECFLGGYRPEDLAGHPDLVVDGAQDARLAPLRETARRRDVTVVVGANLCDRGVLSNAVLWVGNQGDVSVAYRKTHLWGAERDVFHVGDALVVVEACGLTIGLGICYDAGFPELARDLADAGADVLAFSSAFARGAEEDRYWIYHPARAVETSTYVLVSNVLGPFRGVHYFGGSGIWAPDGRRVDNLGVSAGVALVDVDPARCDAQRRLTGYGQTRAALPPLPVMHIDHETLHARPKGQ